AGPGEVSSSSLAGLSQSPFPARIVFERGKEAHEFLRVIGLHHQSVVSWHRIVLARIADTGDPFRCHRFQPNKPKGLMAAICQGGTGSTKQEAASLSIQRCEQTQDIDLTQTIKCIDHASFVG